jgi:hypothetical protein
MEQSGSTGGLLSQQRNVLKAMAIQCPHAFYHNAIILSTKYKTAPEVIPPGLVYNDLTILLFAHQSTVFRIAASL